MDLKRFGITVIVIVVFAMFWNGLVHLVILAGADAALAGITRPSGERGLALSMVITIAIAMLFVWSYARCARRGSEVGWGEE